MLLIPCPWCGPRDEIEFRHGNLPHRPRPECIADQAVSDADWADYLFTRPNPKGIGHERWVHVHGCRQWFVMLRDTVTHAIVATHRLDETVPAAPVRSAR